MFLKLHRSFSIFIDTRNILNEESIMIFYSKPIQISAKYKFIKIVDIFLKIFINYFFSVIGI